MSDTPLTDENLWVGIHGCVKTSKTDGKGYIPESLSRYLERELNAANARLSNITDGFRREQNDIEQTCGMALGYPRYCDDQANFPGATEEDGVCIGDHVAVSIVAELANKYAAAMERIKRLEKAGDALANAADKYGIPYHSHYPEIWREAKEAKP